MHGQQVALLAQFQGANGVTEATSGQARLHAASLQLGHVLFSWVADGVNLADSAGAGLQAVFLVLGVLVWLLLNS